MSFTLFTHHPKFDTKDSGAVIKTVGFGDKMELPCATNIHIPPLSFGLIPHYMRMEKHASGLVMLYRAPHIMMSRSLLVDQGPVEDGVLQTAVFNLSNERVRIASGDIVSWLVAL